MAKLDLDLVKKLRLTKLSSVEEVRRKNNSYAINAEGKLCAVSFSGKEEEELSLEEEAKDLEHLYLAENPALTALEFNVAMPKLKLLYLNNCKLSSLSFSKGCSQLQQVYLQNNLLKHLEWTGNFPALQLIDGSRNRLSMFSLSGSFPELSYLFLWKNQLRQFSFVQPLVALEALDLRENQLQALPDNFLSLTKLKTLYLFKNPLPSLPKEIISEQERGNSWESLRPYLVELSKKDNVINDRSKLIIVGNGRVGKTCIYRRLKGDPCNLEEPYTHGIQIGKLVETDFSELKGSTLQLNVWDFGGQEIFYATHQFFLSEEAIYLLAWTNEKNVIPHRERDKAILPFDEKWRSCEYWLESIRHHGKNSPILMVQTHSDRKENKLPIDPIYAQAPYFAEDLNFSATKDYGLPELRDFILEQLQSPAIPFYGQPFPKSYAVLIEEIENNTQVSSLTKAEFEQKCQKAGISAGGEEAVLAYLNKAGVVVYFNKPLLEDTIFTNPNWLTEQVYLLINNELRAKKGRIDEQYMVEVLPKFTKPERVRFLELLKNFELIFEEVAGQYIAPQYLPTTLSGESQTLFNLTQRNLKLVFVFKFTRFMPDNVMVNFLSRYGPYSDKIYWRNGILFSKNGQACIVEQAEENMLRVCASKHEDSDALQQEICAAFRKLSNTTAVEISLDGIHFAAWHELAKYAGTFLDYPEQIVLATDGFTPLNVMDFARFFASEELNRTKPRPKKIFFSYSKHDRKHLDELTQHLSALRRLGKLEHWDDAQLVPGEEWDEAIKKELNEADIILLLVSAAFNSTDYIWDVEISKAMERHERKEATVIPVIIRDCDWESLPFSKLTGLPAKGKPVSSYADKDQAWVEVIEGIKRVL